MKSHPFVSIVIPVYNGSNYLKEAIDSALAQTYKNLEIIVVNDGSTDNGATEKIAKSYGNKIRYYAKPNGGVATALNLGIEKMTGEYFSWLSHDDMYEKTKIEEEVRLISKLEKNVIVACDILFLYPSGVKKKEHINKDTFEYIDIFLGTSAQVGVNGCALLIPKYALEKAGGFDVNLPVTQDYDLWFRLKDTCRFVLLPKNLVISRRHPEQDSEQKKALMIEAGDELHSRILRSITYLRFEEYFNKNSTNIEHTIENYKIYKSRGYLMAASMILMNILEYYNHYDREKFVHIFNTEIQSGYSYENLLNSNEIAYPLTKSADTEPGDIFGRIHSSIKRDGLMLTFEKLVRKMIR